MEHMLWFLRAVPSQTNVLQPGACLIYLFIWTVYAFPVKDLDLLVQLMLLVKAGVPVKNAICQIFLSSISESEFAQMF